ncbi:unnamed protein product [Adineta steineri]|uniref:Uncharacterized protein n=1 Tax=Adineta steineri TaxID=433720 RepID=A0A813PCK5_9BILA|nr:unnamed protein product [Adineta steineri]CAF4012753.1 unnamed protein product [Adineta steineri]
MGQELFEVHLNTDEPIVITSETITSTVGNDDISLFFSLKNSSDLTESNNDNQIPNSQTEYIKQIRNYLSTLTTPTQWEKLNSDINDILTNNVFPSITEQNNKITSIIDDRVTYKQQLETSLTKKLQDNKYINLSIFAQSFSNATLDNTNQQQDKDKYQSDQLSYFAIQSLISILLLLIKSAEKNDPIIIQQILILTGQLCEQFPVKCLSSKNKFLFKSLEPLTNYIHELSLTTDPAISKQALKILLSFSIAKGSFKDILSLLNKLIFNTSDIYHVQGLIIQLNNGLTEAIDEWEKQNELTEFPSLNYLKSINSYPNTELINLTDDLFTGQFISSIILSHIDIENEINSPIKNFNLSSFSCEFHVNTFKDLFHIIEQLSTIILSQSNNTIIHILTVCLRLFNTHLQILFDHHNDISTYASDIDLKIWFDLLLKLSCTENFDNISINKEASKAFINVINIQILSFNEKLSLFHKYVVENKHTILIQQIFMELNKTETLLDWIEILCDENKKLSALNILYWFIDFHFNESEETKSDMLLSFQKLLLYRLCEKNNNTNQLSSLITEYFTAIFKKNCTNNDLFNSILITLCSMTKSDEFYQYESIQSIFIDILPLLTEYYLKNQDNEFICCLIGRISHVLIIGSPQDSLEIKHLNKLKLPIFAGGCTTDKNNYLFKLNLAMYSQFQQSNNNIEDDKDFLMSIYNNTDDGARLISKLKTCIKTKQNSLQKSIEQQANDACAAVFAVYVKLYRRINLAKSELLRTDENKPYNQLLSIYEYANRIQTLFATIKGQGGDCNELYKQIKSKTLFLLLSVKESDLIPIVKEDVSSIIIDNKPKKANHFQRQHSHWSKAKYVFKLLRHLFQACIRFKRFMLEKKHSIEQKLDYDSLLNRTIDNFIYGDLYKISASVTIEEKQLEIDELEKCLCRQHERATIRLITYRFIKIFIQNLLQLNNNDQCLKTLSIYLPYMRKSDLEWSYFNDILASNNQLRDDISKTYYSIIKLVLSFTLQSNHFVQTIFYLLNLSYESTDICHIYNHQIIEILFQSFVSLANNSNDNTTSIGLKFNAFNWFRLFLMKLCENIEIEKLHDTPNQLLQQQQRFLFNTLILNELKNISSTDSKIQTNNSLKDVSIKWFLQTDQSDINLYINQYLVLLLRCMHFYKYVLSVCATIPFLEQLIYTYNHHPANITRLLTIKILRYLIPSISDNADEIAKNLIEIFLHDTLNSIGENILSQEIIAELIYMYRTIMSIESSWKTITIEIIFNTIVSYLNIESIEKNDLNQMNKLLASLNILGGYIEPYRLGSVVINETNDKLNDESSLALIIDINDTETPYLIQYLQTNQTESVSINKLQLKIDIPPSDLPNTFDSILDLLGYFIQIDTSTNESIMLLQIKRHCISVLYHILNNKKLIEIFMEKPYASIIAQLCISNQQPTDIRLFNKQHLQQYCLSLDTCERLKKIVDNEQQDLVEQQQSISINDQDDLSYSIWNVEKMNQDQLDTNIWTAYNGWRPYVFAGEMEYFKEGRIGIDEITIVPLPRNTADVSVTQECGIKHRFHGRIVPNGENTTVSFPTFIINNLQLSEGKWYYCVRLPQAGLLQMGWATNGFTPSSGCGVGDDMYSWSYDGSRGVLFNAQGFYSQFDDVRWNENDVCGCGIEIDGENTNIKYWLNGKLLGTAFQHKTCVKYSSTKCDLLPNGATTTYYPAISMQNEVSRCCELIISPEDMKDCPLPNGYKPILLPKPLPKENLLIDYPFSAYLIGDDQTESCLTRQTKSDINILRDFVNEHHLETKFFLNNQSVILPDDSDGFDLSVDNTEASSLTVSFDVQLTSTDEKLDIINLFTLDSMEIICRKTDEKLRCVIIFLAKKRQIKVYINNKCRTYPDAFSLETIKTLNIHILPKIACEIKNLAIWKYALSEEQIRRLFNYSLFYIVSDFKRLKDYRKQVNTITFSKNQQEFPDELLLPFIESCTDELWEKKKKQADMDESKYFKTNEDYSTVELYGNRPYLVLNKSDDVWSKFTFVFNLCIPNWPLKDEKLALITLNSKSDILLTSDGKLCFDENGTKYEGHSSIIRNEYFRLSIIGRPESLQIYVNNKLEIDKKNSDDEYIKLKRNRIRLFRESDFTRNTTNEEILRISLKSITYLNRAVSIDQLQSSTLLALPTSIIGLSLMAMGYKKSWIQSVIDENKTTNISTINTILREQKSYFIKQDQENIRIRYTNILTKLDPSIDSEILRHIELSTDEQIKNIAQYILTHSMSLQQSSDENVVESKDKLNPNWFLQSVQHLDIRSNFNEWLRDKTSVTEDEDNIYQLIDIEQKKQTRKKPHESIDYSHKNISSKQFLQSRIACEHGLTIIYARNTILNMLKVWSYDSTSLLFPLEKFGNYTFLISLLKLLDYSEININEKFNRIHILINSILKTEIKQLLEHTDKNDLENQAPLLYHLQKDFIIHSIKFLLKPSLLESNSSGDQQQLNLNFIFKTLDHFVELITDKSIIKQHQIDLIISILFPRQLINLIFNLFLIVSTNQAKISILHLFTTLLQTSESIKLNNQIQQFFCQFLIELSSSTTLSISSYSKKKLEISLLDFIFILLKKQDNSQIKEFQMKLPENIQNLFTTVDVIIAWNDPTKQIPLPEIFLSQSKNILGDNYQLNQDDFIKSNQIFNPLIDQELINFMNNNSLLNDNSFSSFIESLPTESEPNAIFYKNYILLSNVPADSIQNRAKFIYLLNKFVEKSLAIVDFSLSQGQSPLTDYIRTIKLYLLSSTKLQLFHESLEKTEGAYSSDYQTVNFDTVKASTDIEKSESTFFYQAYQQLHTNAHIIFRRSNEQLWQAQYIGMHSTDAGGPYRDSITRICLDICSTRLSLFILCPNGRTNSGLNRDCWIPNVFPPNKSIPKKFKRQYRFIGQLMGMAIRKKHYLDLKFPILLWKQLLKEQITIEDIEAIDAQSFTMINEMEKNIEQIKSMDNDNDNDMETLFSSIMSELRFDVVSSSGQSYELIPNGSEISITASNFKKYCSLYRQYRLNEFNRQINLIRDGLYSIIPCYYLNLFTPTELEEAVCGKGRIDIEILKRNTYYGGEYSQESSTMELFWTVLNEMFTDEQRKLFLIFVWGRSTLPTRDEDFHTKFTITKLDLYEDENVDKILPRSHTCFFTIDLPAYSTSEIMYERLNYAISCCSSIDGDGTINDTVNLDDLSFDDNSEE